MNGKVAFEAAVVYIRRESRPIHSETDTFERTMPIGLCEVDLSYFMSVLFSGQGSATRDLMTTTDPLVGVRLLQEGIPRDEFTFLIYHKTFPTSVIEAVALSPAVGEQLRVDACARRFVICGPEIDSADFSSLQAVLSGMEIVVQKSHQKSLILLSRQLWTVGLERLFMGLWGDSAVDATVTLSSAFSASSRVYLHSVSDLSLLSVDTLDGLLSSESFLVDSEEALLQILFPVRHPAFRRHIRWEFVSAAAIVSLCEDPALSHPTESLWLAAADQLVHPPPPPTWEIDSLIVSEFPPLFEQFRAKRFNLL
jgi:hypothetical protein